MKNIILTILTAFVLVVSAYSQQPGGISPGIRKHSPTEDSIKRLPLIMPKGITLVTEPAWGVQFIPI